jgi:hypothetical protein
MSKKANIFLVSIIMITGIITIVPGALADDSPDLYPICSTFDIWEDQFGIWRWECKIKNGGTAMAGPFCDKLFLRPADPGSIEPWEVYDTDWHLLLRSGKTTWDRGIIEVEEAGYYEAKIIVDYFDDVTESNENNNECSDVFWIGT